MTDRIGAATVNGAARRLMAAVARFVGEAQPTADVPDLRAEVRVLEQRVATLEAARLREGPITGFHTHTVRDCHGLIPCGMPGCCAIRCRHS